MELTSVLPQRKCPQMLAIIAILIFLNIWCSFLFFNSFHFCVSSSKVDLYCFYGRFGGAEHETGFVETPGAVGAPQGRDDSPPQSPLPEDGGNVKERNIGEEVIEAVRFGQAEKLNAVKVVEEQMRVLRSFASKGAKAAGERRRPSSCDVRGVFVYDLPAKFNQDIMRRCGDLSPWSDLCEYFTHEAMGALIPKLGRGWHRTHQYSLEAIFHARVMNHPCRVRDPGVAKLFYVPFYAGLGVLKWHFANVSSDVKDALGDEMLEWLRKQPSWARRSGRDHMFVLGKISWDFRRTANGSWGSNFLLLDQMRNPFKFLIERQPWEINEIGVPHPTHFHPHDDSDIAAWQLRVLNSERRTLVSFAGASRDEAPESIRSALIRQCASSTDCRFLDCKTGGCAKPETVIELFMESEFCLQPPGDSPTRKSVFDSLVSGCIPVFFSPFTAYYQYPWHLPEDGRRYSVFIEEEEVRKGKTNVVERLKKAVSRKERAEMRRYITLEVMPGLVYGDSTARFERYRDAFDIVMDNMMDRVVTTLDQH